MVDLRPWRVPAGVALEVALVVPLVAAVVVVVRNADEGRTSLLTGLAASGFGSTQVITAVVLAALCWWCCVDAVRGSRALAGLGFAIVLLQLLLSLGAVLASVVLIGRTGELRVVAALVQLSWLVLPSLAGAVLLRCALGDGETASAIGPVPATAEIAPAPAPPTAVETYREPAGWAPDEAAGAAWTSAGEAARGARAAGWGTGDGNAWAPSDWSGQPRAVERGPGSTGADPSGEQRRREG